MNREFKKVRKWLETNRMALNISKTNFVLFHSPSKKINDLIRIRLGWETITQLNRVKFLGILMDSTLSWKPHVSELSKKLARNCGMFYKIRHFVKPDTLKLLYYSLFYAFLSYGVTVWGLTHPSITNPLYKLQKKVVCAICFEDKYVHTTPLFHKLKTLKLYYIHFLKLLCFVHVCTKDQPITYFDIFLYPGAFSTSTFHSSGF